MPNIKTWDVIGKELDKKIQIQFKTCYLLFKKQLMTEIDAGNLEAVEYYEKLEDTWRKVEAWEQTKLIH